MATWDEMQKRSFYEASARERAVNLVDKGTFKELISPINRETSPHLPVLGEAVSFDDGIVVGVGKLGQRTVFVVSQEGRFIGGSIGEVNGAKMVGAFVLARELYEEVKKQHPNDDKKVPAIVVSYETGGVRLHESNAGLLAHAEVMDQIQLCRGKIPVLTVVGSRVGCFGGMGFVAASGDAVIMSEFGRIGLTGPEVIEQEMGKKEFDSSDRALVYRTTGGKHKYIMGDAAYLVKDDIGSFKDKIAEVLSMSYADIAKNRLIGSENLVKEQLELVKLAAEIKPNDSLDMWEHFGNKNASTLIDMEFDDFMKTVKRRKKGGCS